MAEIINLRMARKAKARAEEQAQAQGNRVRHGRTRAEKTLADAERERMARNLDGSRRED